EEARLAGLTERWEAEKAVVTSVLELRSKLRAGGGAGDKPEPATEAAEAPAAEAAGPAAGERAALREELATKHRELAALQGESPLILPIVDAQAVASVVCGWTGVSVGRMMRDEIETVLNLEEHLGSRLIGQDHAMGMIAKRIQ